MISLSAVRTSVWIKTFAVPLSEAFTSVWVDAKSRGIKWFKNESSLGATQMSSNGDLHGGLQASGGWDGWLGFCWVAAGSKQHL